MKKWRVFCLAICFVLMAACLAGCGGGAKAGQVTQEDPNTVPEDPYEINWYFSGETLKDVAAVEAAANDYLKDKINATLKINRLETAQYTQQLNTMMATGEYFDCCFVANWCLDYKTNATGGAFLPLDDYLDTYLPKTKALLPEDIWDNAKVNDKIYAIPTKKEFAEARGWAYQKDLAAKYNIDMDSIKSLDELEPVLKMIKENEPDIQYPIDWGTDRTPAALIPYEAVTTQAAIFYDKYEGQVVNLVETPEFEEACLTARRFYEDGLLKKDIATATDFNQRLKDGKTFAYIEFLKPGKAQEVSQNFNFQLAQSPITDVIQLNNAGVGSMMAVSKTSKNPARVMRFLELLNTDKYLNNLINFGIEGKHYTKLEGDYIEVQPNSSYTLSGQTWMTGNVFLNYLLKGEDSDKMEQLETFNRDAKKLYFYGFKFNPEPVQQQIAACETVGKEYRPQVTLGGVDPLPVLEEYKAKLKTAGIDTVIAEVQKQLDEFLANKDN